MAILRWVAAVIALALGDPASSGEPDEFPKTAPKTWSSDGAFNVKWGMGPGDVRAVYPDLKGLDHREPTPSFVRDDHVEGMRVTAYFTFFKGRLYEIKFITQRGYVTREDEELESYWSREKAWLESLKPILSEKYGPATERVVTRSLTEQKLPAWMWHRGRTGVLLVSGPMASLQYVDVEAVNAAEAAEKAREAAEVKMKQDRL